jgi:predicted DNA-binding antitoxin AbrB/MazE fold protein
MPVALPAGPGLVSNVTTAIDAVYEGGLLRPLQPLSLPEHAQVRISVETLPIDAERTEWLNQSERRLLEVWDNDADDVYNELLTR